jgi:hypothetical protein
MSRPPGLPVTLCCLRCWWSRPFRPGTPLDDLTCPTCHEIMAPIGVSATTLDPLPEPEPDEPQQRQPLAGQPRLL